MKILRVYKAINKRHAKQSKLWKLLHKAKMLVCNHDSIEPIKGDEYSYWSRRSFAECHNCEALLEIKE